MSDVYAYDDEPAAAGTAASAATAGDLKPVLEVRGVHKQFGDVQVLRGIDLSVLPHQVIVLVGSSGSGKSTLLKTINLIERVDDGQIFLDGEDISDPRANADAVRSRIGVVFQHFNLFPHMTVLDNVTLAARKVHKTPRAEAAARGTAILERVGLGAHATSYPDRLSGGQQQRVAIARAIMTEPKVLLLDEITSALDPQLVGEVLDVVLELKEQGATILMATHEMSFARRVADQIVFLKDGVLIERAAPEQFFTNPQRPETVEFLSRVSLGA